MPDALAQQDFYWEIQINATDASSGVYVELLDDQGSIIPVQSEPPYGITVGAGTVFNIDTGGVNNDSTDIHLFLDDAFEDTEFITFEFKTSPSGSPFATHVYSDLFLAFEAEETSFLKPFVGSTASSPDIVFVVSDATAGASRARLGGRG